jgi:clan AA aspartic protease
MDGRVTARQAVLAVVLRARGRPDLALDFVVDTGFAGALTLPPAAVSALRLPLLGEITANLADDSTIAVNAHRATILWYGRERAVEVLATGARPLLGTLLLDGHALAVAFTEGGAVTVEPLL